MSATIEKTLAFLMEDPKICERKIRSVHLNSYFTVVELDDTSVGAVGSNYALRHGDLVERQSTIYARLERDPLLLKFTSQPADDPVAKCIRAATISALSAPILGTGEDPFFFARREFPREFFNEIRYAFVAGFGGFLDYLVRRTNVRRIHVSDTSSHARRRTIEKIVADYREIRPGIEISDSDGSDSEAHLDRADFASISGSMLTSEGFERLLFSARNCKKIVVQGQGASIHPKELFALGVHLVATTIKTREVAKAAFWDPTGGSLRPLFEGGLPYVFLWPQPQTRRPGKMS